VRTLDFALLALPAKSSDGTFEAVRVPELFRQHSFCHVLLEWCLAALAIAAEAVRACTKLVGAAVEFAVQADTLPIVEAVIHVCVVAAQLARAVLLSADI